MDAAEHALEDLRKLKEAGRNQWTAAGRAFYENALEKFIENHTTILEDALNAYNSH